MYRRRRLFQTSADRAIFIPLHKIRRQRDDWQKTARQRATEDLKPPVDETEKYGLRIGERVVWISDSGPEKGTVKWVGLLPEDSNQSVTAGVEFVSVFQFFKFINQYCI